MNNQLPEHNWKFKLYSYSSPVDKGLLRKVLDAKNKNGDQPAFFWLILSILLIFIGGSLVLIDNRTADTNTIKNMPIPVKGLQQEPAKDISKIERTAPQQFEPKHSKKSGHKNDDPSSGSIVNGTNDITPPDQGISEGSAEKLSMGNAMQEKRFILDMVYNPYTGSRVYGKSGKKKYPAGLLTDFSAMPASFSLPPLFSPMEGRLDPGADNELKINSYQVPECPDFGEHRNDWYLEVFGALDFPHKKMVDVLGKSDFLEKKDSSEEFLLSYSAGFRISRNISQSWLLKTGIHFSQFNESFHYRNEKERRITTIVTIRTIIRAPGDTLYVSDSSQVEVIGVRVKKTNNRYRNIDIPLLLSYEVRNPGFTIAFQGGTIFNLRSTFHGDMLDTTGFPISQSGKDPASQFNKSMGFGLYAGASLIKSVANDLDIFAEPYYRRYLNNQASAEAPFEQYLSNWGVQFGIRYKLNAGGQRY